MRNRGVWVRPIVHVHRKVGELRPSKCYDNPEPVDSLHSAGDRRLTTPETQSTLLPTLLLCLLTLSGQRIPAEAVRIWVGERTYYALPPSPNCGRTITDKTSLNTQSC